MKPLMLVRLKPGCGPESARVVHLAEVDEGPEYSFSDHPGPTIGPDDTLRSLCGRYLIRGTYDVLPGVAGMPCVRCSLNSPGPEKSSLEVS